eukprot:1136169-Pelagomonas_calceolata.AAC.4
MSMRPCMRAEGKWMQLWYQRMRHRWLAHAALPPAAVGAAMHICIEADQGLSTAEWCYNACCSAA